MIFYAVKSKSTDMFLPWVKGSNSKAELCDPKEHPMRLFKSYKGASQAMRAWAKGIHRGYGNWESDDDPYSSACYFVLDKIGITPQRHRRLADVCVVEINMAMREVSSD